MLQAQVENMRQMVAAATTTGNVTTSPGRNEGGGAEGGGAGDTDAIDKLVESPNVRSLVPRPSPFPLYYIIMWDRKQDC